MTALPKPDMALKHFFQDNRIFTDFFNAVLFQGQQILKADELQEVNAEYSVAVTKENRIQSVHKQRDLIRKAALGAQFILCGIENQDKIHYSMPVRNMLYDALEYTEQCQKIAAEQDSYKGWTVDEFLSGMPKGTKLFPCFTIVVYYGETVWDGPKNLAEMLQTEERLQPYIQNYMVNLVEVRLGMNGLPFENEDLRALFTMLHDIYEKVESEQEYKPRIAKLAGILTRTPKIYQMAEKGECVKVCKAWQEMEDKARQEGCIEGEQEGRRKEKIQIAKVMLSREMLDIEQISICTGLTVDELRLIEKE